MMKTYTVEIEVNEGNDEFWDDNPQPEEVLKVIKEDIEGGNLNISSIKIVKIVDLNTYEQVID